MASAAQELISSYKRGVQQRGAQADALQTMRLQNTGGTTLGQIAGFFSDSTPQEKAARQMQVDALAGLDKDGGRQTMGTALPLNPTVAALQAAPVAPAPKPVAPAAAPAAAAPAAIAPSRPAYTAQDFARDNAGLSYRQLGEFLKLAPTPSKPMNAQDQVIQSIAQIANNQAARKIQNGVDPSVAQDEILKLLLPIATRQSPVDYAIANSMGLDQQ